MNKYMLRVVMAALSMTFGMQAGQQQTQSWWAAVLKRVNANLSRFTPLVNRAGGSITTPAVPINEPTAETEPISESAVSSASSSSSLPPVSFASTEIAEDSSSGQVTSEEQSQTRALLDGPSYNAFFNLFKDAYILSGGQLQADAQRMIQHQRSHLSPLLQLRLAEYAKNILDEVVLQSGVKDTIRKNFQDRVNLLNERISQLKNQVPALAYSDEVDTIKKLYQFAEKVSAGSDEERAKKQTALLEQAEQLVLAIPQNVRQEVAQLNNFNFDQIADKAVDAAKIIQKNIIARERAAAQQEERIQELQSENHSLKSANADLQSSVDALTEADQQQAQKLSGKEKHEQELKKQLAEKEKVVQELAQAQSDIMRLQIEMADLKNENSRLREQAKGQKLTIGEIAEQGGVPIHTKYQPLGPVHSLEEFNPAWFNEPPTKPAQSLSGIKLPEVPSSITGEYLEPRASMLSAAPIPWHEVGKGPRGKTSALSRLNEWESSIVPEGGKLMPPPLTMFEQATQPVSQEAAEAGQAMYETSTGTGLPKGLRPESKKEEQALPPAEPPQKVEVIQEQAAAIPQEELVAVEESPAKNIADGAQLAITYIFDHWPTSTDDLRKEQTLQELGKAKEAFAKQQIKEGLNILKALNTKIKQDSNFDRLAGNINEQAISELLKQLTNGIENMIAGQP